MKRRALRRRYGHAQRFVRRYRGYTFAIHPALRGHWSVTIYDPNSRPVDMVTGPSREAAVARAARFVTELELKGGK